MQRKHVKVARQCAACDKPLSYTGVGRPPVYHSAACRQSAYAHRRRRSVRYNWSWYTPEVVRAWVLAHFDIALDVAADAVSCLVDKYFGLDRRTPWDDALACDDWCAYTLPRDALYANPPYSPATLLVRFLERMVATAAAGRTVVALLPFEPSNNWWKEFVVGRDAAFVDLGRLRFGGPESNGQPARRPSALVVWPRDAVRQEDLQELARLCRADGRRIAPTA